MLGGLLIPALPSVESRQEARGMYPPSSQPRPPTHKAPGTQIKLAHPPHPPFLAAFSPPNLKPYLHHHVRRQGGEHSVDGRRHVVRERSRDARVYRRGDTVIEE